MEQKEQIKQQSDTSSMSYCREDINDEINLVDLIYPIYKRRKFLIFFCLAITIIVGVRSLFLPKVYEATAIILPVTDMSSTSISQGLASTFLQQFGMSSLLGSSSSTSTSVFEAYLESKELTTNVLQGYDYFTMMGVTKSGEKNTIKSFAGQVQVTKSSENPSISVRVQSDDPVFASDLANTYVKQLNEYNLNNSYTSTRQLREYLEKRMEETVRELDQAQVELREFQEKNNAISISQQAEATLNVLAQLEAEKISLEVQKASKEKFYKGSHIEIEQLDAKMEALRKNIDLLTYSKETSVPIEREGGKIEFYIPMNSVPGLDYEESKLLLKVSAKTGVITLLTTQLEQARLDEAKDMPTINVLEWSTPPSTPIGTNIKLKIIVGLFVSFFLGVFIIYLIEFIQRMDHDPETAPKWLEIKKGVMDLFNLKRIYKFFR